MTLLKLLFSISIIYIATMAIENCGEKSNVVRHNASNYILSDYNILPLHYDIKLQFLYSNVFGECVITIYIVYATQYIHFHVPDSINITKSKLIKNDNGMNCTIISRNYDKDNIVVLNFKNVLLTGMYNLSITYKIKINIIRESFGTSYIKENGDKE